MLKNSLLSLISRFIVAICKFGTFIVIAKKLDIGNFGEFNLIMSVTFIMAMFFLMGYQHAIISVNSKAYHHDIFTYVSLVFNRILMVLSMIVGYVIYKAFGYSTLDSLMLGYAISAQIFFMVTHSIFISKNQFKNSLYANIVQSMIFFILVFLSNSNSPVVYLFTFSIANSLSVFIIKPKIKRMNIKVKKMKRVLKLQLLIGIKNLSFEVNNIIHNRFDLIFIKILGNDMQLGLYAMVKNIIEGILYLPKALQPVLLREGAIHKRELSLGKISKMISVIFILIIIIFALFGKELISALYGTDYLQGYLPLLISVIGIYFYSLALIYNFYHLGTGNFKAAINSSFVTSIIFIIANLALIPFFGVIGASIAVVVSSSAYLIISFGKFPKKIKLC